MIWRLAAYKAGQPPRTASAAAMPDKVSPAATVYRTGPCWPGSTRTVPATMRSGSGPMICRLAAYRAGQPPRTFSCAAMPDKVSPCCTTYFPAGLAARTGAETAPSMPATVTCALLLLLVLLILLVLLVLLAMRMFA